MSKKIRNVLIGLGIVSLIVFGIFVGTVTLINHYDRSATTIPTSTKELSAMYTLKANTLLEQSKDYISLRSGYMVPNKDKRYGDVVDTKSIVKDESEYKNMAIKFNKKGYTELANKCNHIGNALDNLTKGSEMEISTVGYETKIEKYIENVKSELNKANMK